MSCASGYSQIDGSGGALPELASVSIPNGDLTSRRRREQVRQACQHCRRRKIKVRLYLRDH
jgi:ribosome recycling factor